jgi:hypothetical protein
VQTRLAQQTSTIDALQTENNSLKVRIDETEHTLQEKLVDIKAFNELRVQETEEYTQEIAAQVILLSITNTSIVSATCCILQRKVVDVLKRNLDEAIARVHELEGDVNVMRESLHRVKEEYKERLEQQRIEAENVLANTRVSFSDPECVPAA